VEGHPRDHALLRLLYNGGLRVSEAVSLQWRNLIDGIVNVRGKGGRTRVVRLSRGTWAELQALRPTDALGDDRVFPMTAWNAWDRVRRAARSAGLEALVSPHFLRHSHGTHAVRRGADPLSDAPVVENSSQCSRSAREPIARSLYINACTESLTCSAIRILS